MPELPEVETVRNILNKQLVNKTISSIEIIYSKLIKNDTSVSFSNKLNNQEIIKIDRYAKYLLFIFSDYTIVSHLRMEGKYFYIDESVNVDEINQKHVLLKYKFSDGSELWYHDTRKFGTIEIFKNSEFNKDEFFSRLGNEPWDINKDDFYSKLNKTSRPIKNVILDQSIISGLGNIYVDEVLLYSKINPFTKGNEITKEQSDKIVDMSVKVLKRAIELKGTTIKSYTSSLGVEGSYQNERVAYAMENEPCFRCGEKIKKVKLSGRGTHYCANCQK